MMFRLMRDITTLGEEHHTVEYSCQSQKKHGLARSLSIFSKSIANCNAFLFWENHHIKSGDEFCSE